MIKVEPYELIDPCMDLLDDLILRNKWSTDPHKKVQLDMQDVQDLYDVISYLYNKIEKIREVIDYECY